MYDPLRRSTPYWRKKFSKSLKTTRGTPLYGKVDWWIRQHVRRIQRYGNPYFTRACIMYYRLMRPFLLRTLRSTPYSVLLFLIRPCRRQNAWAVEPCLFSNLRQGLIRRSYLYPCRIRVAILTLLEFGDRYLTIQLIYIQKDQEKEEFLEFP